MLIPLLDNPAYSPDEQFQATVLLSYTYKRLLDYTTALSWLTKAGQLARQTTRPDSNQTQIQAQLALSYQYAKSDRLMRQLERNHFRYLDPENRAKIVHQQGYLLFLAKQYPEADALYDRAMLDLQASSPCDMPMILVKKMQLYAAMNQMQRVETTLQQTCRYADSCGIVKYKIYAYDELKGIYKARHDLIGMAQATSVLDSLNQAYAQTQHMAELHNQHQTLEREKQDRQLATRQQWLTYALAGLGTLALLALGLWIALRRRRARQLRMEAELDRMRTELTALMTLSSSPLVPPAVLPMTPTAAPTPTYPPRLQRPDLSTLSDRQRDVLDGIVAGLSNRDIADKLFVSENTVKYHLKNIYVLLNVRDRVDLLVNLTGK
ncbi:helix-turn-helix transcriptional regulator [Fibrella sp. HMF5036]|uniref:Helix-turn-helix transcriptional regulator n=1 Tax=Fibrella aquatilis TaxID=2817059 RepID=A0A939G6L6_9BACT|nr:helix-turn-helix transcriptional regulator [Fibrella aquatilis]